MDAYHIGELELLQDIYHPRRILPVIGLHHKTVLDVGCGAGQTLIARGIPKDVQAIGVDMDESALALGKRLAPNIEFILARGEHLPFKDESFDLIVCRVALPYMHVSTALKEMSRVLRPGGDIWLTLHRMSWVLRELLAAASNLDAKLLLKELYVLANGIVFYFSGCEFHFPFRPNKWESFQTDKGIRRILSKLGFGGISIDCSHGSFVVQASRTRRE